MKFLLFLIFLSFLSCKKETADSFLSPQAHISNGSSKFDNTSPLINKDKNTIRQRFEPPLAFTWVDSPRDSYAHFIETFPLENYGTAIYKYNGAKGATQHLHEAVFKLDIGKKDLQQCADAIIRLRAEYLYKENKQDEIIFHFTSGDAFSWKDYKKGIRPIISGNQVSFLKKAIADDSRQSFRDYLEVIFTYAGTISLFKESKTLSADADLQTGDFVITPGSPGHVVFIAGVSKNTNGKKLYLLAEGFTPAQSVSVMKNPYDALLSPWYRLEAETKVLKTARYVFSPVVFKKHQ